MCPHLFVRLSSSDDRVVSEGYCPFDQIQILQLLHRPLSVSSQYVLVGCMVMQVIVTDDGRGRSRICSIIGFPDNFHRCKSRTYGTFSYRIAAQCLTRFAFRNEFCSPDRRVEDKHRS